MAHVVVFFTRVILFCCQRRHILSELAHCGLYESVAMVMQMHYNGENFVCLRRLPTFVRLSMGNNRLADLEREDSTGANYASAMCDALGLD